MENTRLWALFSTFSKKELRALQKMVESPFFNQRKDVIVLFDLLCEAVEGGFKPKSKQDYYQRIYPGSSYLDQKIRTVISLLFKVCEQYLIYQRSMEDEVIYKTQLARAYRHRNLNRHFNRGLSQARNLLEDRGLRNAEYHNSSYRIELEKYTFAASNRRMESLNLQDLNNQLDLAFMARKLRQTCLLLSHQAVYKTEYDFGLLAEILRYIEARGLFEIPAIGTYYYCYMALSDSKNVKYFEQFRAAMRQHKGCFPASEARDLYLLAINFCIRQYNEGNSEFLEEEFYLYQQGLEQQYLLMDGYISRFSFRNVVTIALIMKKFDWVEEFIQSYKELLRPAQKESMFSFSMANLEYERRNYGAALQLLQKSEYKDLLLNLASKTLQLRIYYELGEMDLLESHLDAMRTFIRRKNIMTYHRRNYLNTITFTKKLMNLQPFDQKGRKKLLIQIEETKALAEREWLIKQVS